jgi:hypothetical protein
VAKRPSVPISADQGERFPLRVLRLDPGEKLTVVFRTARVTGLFTHFTKGRSRYCDPACCAWGCPKAERCWKGYDLVDAHDVRKNIWVPWVLEITEHLELDLRGLYSRGQVWELSCGEQSKEHRSPVTGKFLGVASADQVGPPMPFESTLRSLYHVERIALDERNPMPDRILVVARKGPLKLEKPKLAEPSEETKPYVPLTERYRQQTHNGAHQSTEQQP